MAPDSPTLSKRAARRLIQRAVVLAGRDRHIRTAFRESELRTVWVLEDWRLEWTIAIHRGRIEYDRRPAKHPAAVLAWPSAGAFLGALERGERPEFRFTGAPEVKRQLEPLVKAFAREMQAVIANPVDENGDSLLGLAYD
jgi:hypothetical protein